jgi:hypothetical protein
VDAWLPSLSMDASYVFWLRGLGGTTISIHYAFLGGRAVDGWDNMDAESILFSSFKVGISMDGQM